MSKIRAAEPRRILRSVQARAVAVLAILALVVGGCASPPADPAPSTRAEPSAGASATTTASPAETASGAPSATEEPEPLAWSRLDVDGPEPREDHSWTVDDTGETAWLFGGRDGATVFGDTWSFDLATDTWTRLDVPAAPPARFGHEATWVDGIGLVVFAGQSGPDTFFNDLWVFDPVAATWARLPAGGAVPTPRYGSCAAIGPDGRLWISHGFTEEGARFSDTRAYDFASASWTDVTPADGPRPVERCLHGCWWTDDGALALYAGQTTGLTALDDLWLLDDEGWTQVDGALPPARNLYARARVDGGTIVVGGQGVDGGYLDDLWLLADGASDAVTLDPAGEPPPARAGGELIVDPATGRAILFGGRTAEGPLGDTWVLTGL
jgi:hypothetical protein